MMTELSTETFAKPVRDTRGCWHAVSYIGSQATLNPQEALV